MDSDPIIDKIFDLTAESLVLKEFLFWAVGQLIAERGDKVDHLLEQLSSAVDDKVYSLAQAGADLEIGELARKKKDDLIADLRKALG